ncbi:MAG: NAD-dependent epimerase/dehydratase family protein [Deltaproteobacteria bacterium]|nr:NAD-dependent epimerase/dehydratase family protein [Deltaproteobacteria bacterium]
MAEEKKPKVLITGARGALAQQVITRMKSHFRLVIVDFRRRVVMDEDIPSYFVHITKRGFEDIFREHKIDGIIHLGRMESDESNRFSRYNANVLGTQNMLDLCIKYNVSQVLILSTFFVYGANAYNPVPLDEGAPLKASALTKNLVDTVELENLAHIYMWKHRDLNLTILRPCNIVGPGVRNSMSLLLSRKTSPVLIGFNPMMQFIHIGDIAKAIVKAYKKNTPGIYNVAPNDWVGYQDALVASGCRRIPIPSIPPVVPMTISRFLNLKSFPSYLINYFKYPAIIDGSLFAKTFNFKPSRGLDYIFQHYRRKKSKKPID